VSSNLGIVVRKPLNREDMISRDYNAELKARVGTKTLVSPDNPNAAGFFCKETGKTLRDSISYLDHINGKKRACPFMEPCDTPSAPLH
jgi:U4/U6.U5 tri-snRNP component SNU23